MLFAKSLFVAALVLIRPASVFASPILIDFESLADSEILTNQIPGLIFMNATAITAGISLNEFEFPPASGQNVVFDDGGPISINFVTPVLSFGGYFTYLAPLTLSAFDAGNNLLGVVNSTYQNNLALSGDPGSSPNEFLFFSSVAGIGAVTITADPIGESFTLDDATISASAVPEPDKLLLILLGLGGVVALRRWCDSRSRLSC